ncbi:MAG: hypothetical protein ACE5F9_04680 [Phycisphaerae bacterium]
MMDRKRWFSALLTAGLVMACAAGCDVIAVFGPPRTTDGGGGSILSAGSKVALGQMTNLTQDELQILSDQVNSLITAANPNVPVQELTNAQADGFIDFLKQNAVPGSSAAGLNSIDDIQTFTQAAIADPTILVVPQSLIDAFAGTTDEIDTSNIDVNQLFDSVFSGLTPSTGGTANP